MPARSSAPASRRSAAARCTTRSNPGARRSPRLACKRNPASEPRARRSRSSTNLRGATGVACRRVEDSNRSTLRARASPRSGEDATRDRPLPREGAPRHRRARRRFVEKIWLKHYPKGVPAEIDVNEYASVREVFEESVAQFGERPSFTCMGKTLTFDELEHAVRGVRVVPPGERLREGHARRADDAQHPPVSGVPVRHPARRMHGGERQSALHGARARAPARRTRAPRSSSSSRISRTRCRRSSARTKLRRVVVTTIGELLGFKGIAVDLVIRHVKKMVPEVEPAGFDQALRRARRRAAAARSSGSGSVTRTSRSCNTPAARPASRRAPCCCTGTSSPTCCRRARGSGRSSATSAKSSSRRCRSTTSSR